MADTDARRDAVTDEMVALPLPAIVYADHSYPAYSRKQMLEYAAAVLAQAGPAWQPIERPSDVEKWVIARDYDEGWHVVWFDGEVWINAANYEVVFGLTHWMHFPASRACSGGRAEG